MLSDKQKSEREASLGSSDAPIVCGVSPYKSPLALYYGLHGELPRYSDDESEAIKWGERLEPVIAQAAAEKLGVKIRRIPGRFSKHHAWMTAHLDFEIVNNPKGPGILEVKNRMGKSFDQLPDDLTLQVAHQLAVTEREWAIVAVLFGFGKLQTFEVERDKELEQCLIEIEARFMVRVQKGEPPDHSWTPETVGILKKLYPTDSGQTIALPEQALTYIGQFRQAKEDLDRIEAQKSEAEGWLKERMQSATFATAPGYNISWRSTKASRKFDLEKFEQEQPDLFKQYLKTVPGYRRFHVKPAKELL